jgi:hypothetical protein
VLADWAGQLPRQLHGQLGCLDPDRIGAKPRSWPIVNWCGLEGLTLNAQSPPLVSFTNGPVEISEENRLIS